MKPELTVSETARAYIALKQKEAPRDNLILTVAIDFRVTSDRLGERRDVPEGSRPYFSAGFCPRKDASKSRIFNYDGVEIYIPVRKSLINKLDGRQVDVSDGQIIIVPEDL